MSSVLRRKRPVLGRIVLQPSINTKEIAAKSRSGKPAPALRLSAVIVTDSSHYNWHSPIDSANKKSYNIVVIGKRLQQENR